MSNKALVVVTGAAGALGRAVAETFRGDGARLILIDVDAARLREIWADSSSDVLSLAIDLLDATAVVTALTPVLDKEGPATVLCNIAGGFAMGAPLHEMPDAHWRQMMDVNVATLINASRAVIPGMIRARHGKVINVAAAAAGTGRAGMGAYCAAKSAVARVTETMAFELRDYGINVNAVAPSILDTPANRAAMPEADFSHWVSTGDLSRVIRMLASDDARAIHGAVIPVVGLS